jgi:hypothetical protein
MKDKKAKEGSKKTVRTISNKNRHNMKGKRLIDGFNCLSEKGKMTVMALLNALLLTEEFRIKKA